MSNHINNNSQAIYLQRVKNIVANSTEIIHQATQENQCLTTLFFTLLKKFGGERCSIAQGAREIAWADFGSLRTIASQSHTPLTGPVYEKYSTQWNSIVQTKIKTHFKPQDAAQSPPITIQTSFLERTCVQVFHLTNIHFKSIEHMPFFNSLFNDLTKGLPLFHLILIGERQKQELFSHALGELASQSQGLPTLESYKKSKAAPVYKKLRDLPSYPLSENIPPFFHLKMQEGIVFAEFHRLKTEKMTHWCHTVTQLSVNNHIETLSTFTIPTNINFHTGQMEPLENPQAIIVHTDPSLIGILLDDLSNIFKRCIEQKEISQLKKEVALFQYEFAHTMPFFRGSAAVCEWFGDVIFQYHGYQLKYAEGVKIDLKALLSTLDEFEENYNSFIQLSELKDQPALLIDPLAS